MNDKANTHFFASNAFGWGTAPTREEAVAKAVRYGFGGTAEAKKALQRAQKAGEPGIYIWSCEVQAPADADYNIENYQPKGVEWDSWQDEFVTFVSAKEIAIYSDPKRHLQQQIRDLKARLEAAGIDPEKVVADES